MYPRPFDYFSPKNLAEALELLQTLGAETKILAGDQSLIPSMKLRILSLKNVVDITGIKELNYIRKEENMLKIIQSKRKHAEIIQSKRKQQE